jgi:hypothetical protein
VNTFVPRGEDYLIGARELDTKRLVKQLVECQQIYDALLTHKPVSIFHHPATQMWQFHIPALLDYAAAVYTAYKERFNDRLHKSGEYLARMRSAYAEECKSPAWVQDMAPYHQAKLYWKDPLHYSQYESRTPRGMATAEPNYPVMSKGEHVGWVHKPYYSRQWLIAGFQHSIKFNTAWEAIQFLQSFLRK